MDTFEKGIALEGDKGVISENDSQIESLPEEHRIVQSKGMVAIGC